VNGLLSPEGVAWIVTLKMVVLIIRPTVLTVHRQEQAQHQQGQHTSPKPRHEPLQFVRKPQI
jgi:hypothetical protein